MLISVDKSMQYMLNDNYINDKTRIGHPEEDKEISPISNLIHKRLSFKPFEDVIDLSIVDNKSDYENEKDNINRRKSSKVHQPDEKLGIDGSVNDLRNESNNKSVNDKRVSVRFVSDDKIDVPIDEIKKHDNENMIIDLPFLKGEGKKIDKSISDNSSVEETKHPAVSNISNIFYNTFRSKPVKNHDTKRDEISYSSNNKRNKRLATDKGRNEHSSYFHSKVATISNTIYKTLGFKSVPSEVDSPSNESDDVITIDEVLVTPKPLRSRSYYFYQGKHGVTLANNLIRRYLRRVIKRKRAIQAKENAGIRINKLIRILLARKKYFNIAKLFPHTVQLRLTRITKEIQAYYSLRVYGITCSESDPFEFKWKKCNLYDTSNSKLDHKKLFFLSDLNDEVLKTSLLSEYKMILSRPTDATLVTTVVNKKNQMTFNLSAPKYIDYIRLQFRPRSRLDSAINVSNTKTIIKYSLLYMLTNIMSCNR